MLSAQSGECSRLPLSIPPLGKNKSEWKHTEHNDIAERGIKGTEKLL